ncbi:MAG: alanine racemase [Verrucomicrobiota bacterium]|nr:alanine racemase [Verrucomicrobiota bacterium]
MNADRCWAEISSAAMRHNASVAQRRVGPGVALLGVIKANGYGHGLAAVAKAIENDAQLFGVANLEEAFEARGAVPHPILILGPALDVEREAIVEHGFIATISSFEEARAFAAAARTGTAFVDCEIDTGMGRMGIAEADALRELHQIAALPQVKIHSISTHLPSADEDPDYTREQLTRFSALVRQIRAQIAGDYKVHALLSAGILGYNDECFDIARLGLALYGVSPDPKFQDELRAPLTWKSRVVLLRDIPVGTAVSYGRTWTAARPTRVATLSVGYADGYPRSLSHRGASVLIRGQRCPGIGRVTMDLTLVDVTDAPNVSLGDEVVLIGRQGDEEISAREIADRAGTIAWEVFTGIGARVTRVYL